MDKISKKFATEVIIWSSFAFSMAIYAGLPYLAPDIFINKQEFLPEYLLYALCGSLAAGSIMAKKFFNQANNSAISTANIISWALNEAIAILGFINSFLTANHEKSLQIIGIAFAVHLMTFPKNSKDS